MTYPLTSRLPLALPHCARLHTADSFQFLKPALFPTSGPLCMQLLLPEVIFLPSASVLTLQVFPHSSLDAQLAHRLLKTLRDDITCLGWGQMLVWAVLWPTKKAEVDVGKDHESVLSFRFLTARERTGGRVKYCGLQRSSFKVSKDEISVGFFKGKWHDKLWALKNGTSTMYEIKKIQGYITQHRTYS